MPGRGLGYMCAYRLGNWTGIELLRKGYLEVEGLLDHRGFEAMIGIAVVAECEMFMVKG